MARVGLLARSLAVLQRFGTRTRYYNAWPEDEQLFRFKQCIQGDAQYMLIDTVLTSSVSEFVAILRDRVGTAAQAERYHVELARLRRGHLTIVTHESANTR